MRFTEFEMAMRRTAARRRSLLGDKLERSVFFDNCYPEIVGAIQQASPENQRRYLEQVFKKDRSDFTNADALIELWTTLNDMKFGTHSETPSIETFQEDAAEFMHGLSLPSSPVTIRNDFPEKKYSSVDSAEARLLEKVRDVIKQNGRENAAQIADNIAEAIVLNHVHYDEEEPRMSVGIWDAARHASLYTVVSDRIDAPNPFLSKLRIYEKGGIPVGLREKRLLSLRRKKEFIIYVPPVRSSTHS